MEFSLYCLTPQVTDEDFHFSEIFAQIHAGRFRRSRRLVCLHGMMVLRSCNMFGLLTITYSPLCSSGEGYNRDDSLARGRV